MSNIVPIKQAKRKGISKKTRFEVFKRDNFTCQYCGGQSPDVILRVDHINPVAGGGDNDILNLITSCEPCNQGKGARPLDDQSVLARQRAQLKELNERREQLEMMLQWREGLSNLDEDYIDAFDRIFHEHTNSNLSESGRKKFKSWLKHHTLAELIDAFEAAVPTYFKDGDPDPERANELAGKTFNMTIRVAMYRKRHGDDPAMKDLFYTRAILRNRLNYVKEHEAIDLLKQAHALGAHMDELKDWAKRARNWTNWRQEMESWIEELGGPDEQD